MCGIAGIVGWQRSGEARVAAMTRALYHRGPDGSGTFTEGPVSLGHTRLALLDREGGAQPMRSADGRYALVYNGEVYDCDALRRQLPRWHFRTRSDAEVVLAAWATWGKGCLRRLNGMFAFFVWDAHTQEGVLVRDLLGVKPVAYALDDGELLFASEAKALVGVRARPRRADTEALLEYLVAPAWSGVAHSMFEGIDYLQPGHMLEISRGGVRLSRWGTHAPLDDSASAEELHAALDAAVRRTLVADAPVGIFLSGGLDSTLLAALARRAGAMPHAYTIAFAEQADFDYARSVIVVSDDAPFAALAAHELGLERTQVDVDRRTLPDDLATLSRTNDALPAWEQELAQHHLARAAAKTCKAVLVGDAADETHSGYHFLLDPVATSTPARILERFCEPLVRADVLPRPIEHFDAKYRVAARAAGHDWDHDGVAATSWLVRERWLPRLLHNGDVHCMAHGLEARVPFADLDVLAVAARIGAERAQRGGVEKAVLREAARGLVPEPIRTRRKSALPKDQHAARVYQREGLRALDDALVQSLLDASKVRALCDPARTLDERERALLFRVVCLAHWARTYEVDA